MSGDKISLLRILARSADMSETPRATDKASEGYVAVVRRLVLDGHLQTCKARARPVVSRLMSTVEPLASCDRVK